MSRADRNDHRGVPDLKVTYPVDDGEADDVPAGGQSPGKLSDDLRGARVRRVVQGIDAAPAVLLSHDTDERGNRPSPRVPDSIEHLIDGQRNLAELSEHHLRTSARLCRIEAAGHPSAHMVKLPYGDVVA
jgi:hypothetical protein